MSVNFRELSVNGLWKNNPALVQLLGLSPLLAVSSSAVNAIGLGLATLLVIICSTVAISLLQNFVSEAIRLPAFVMIIAAFTTCVELLMKAHVFELYQNLGIFIPLIVSNCFILARMETFASRNSALPAAVDGCMMGLGFALVLLVLGGVREIIGSGSLFANMDLLFGPAAANWVIGPVENYPGVLIALLPPGAFIITGMLLAVKNSIDQQAKRRAGLAADVPAAASRRVRVTGTIR